LKPPPILKVSRLSGSFALAFSWRPEVLTFLRLAKYGNEKNMEWRFKFRFAMYEGKKDEKRK